MTKDVDITPSWQGLVPAMCPVLENPKASFESKAHIKDQIMLSPSAAKDLTRDAVPRGGCGGGLAQEQTRTLNGVSLTRATKRAFIFPIHSVQMRFKRDYFLEYSFVVGRYYYLIIRPPKWNLVGFVRHRYFVSLKQRLLAISLHIILHTAQVRR